MRKFLKGLSRIIFSRGLIIVLMLLIQTFFLIWAFFFLAGKIPYVYYVSYLVATVVLIRIVNLDVPAEFKLTWAVIILIMPVIGVLLYLFNASNWGMIGLKHKVAEELNWTRNMIEISEGTAEAIREEARTFQHFSYYMDEKCDFPTYHNTNVTYYPDGEETIAAILAELKRAEKFILIEFFIISRGEVWDSILEILKEKVKEGVEVKVMYDGLCSLLKLPYHYPKKLAEYGIEAKMFAPLIPFLSTAQNNRDHRKILVIDGRVAFTGGVNLADEYANRIQIYGHWKDVGLRLEGRAVMSMTRLFIQNWNLYGKMDADYAKYLEESFHLQHFGYNGFVIPYGDVPTDEYDVGKTVYSHIFATATEYVHIMMPYFIVDREFLSAIKYASVQGIDVKLILPHIPDKKSVFAMARSFYPDLLASGVKVYEYLPGFVHAKVMVSDDTVATVGSVNLDYRSFYHHFENGVYLYHTSVTKEIEADFQRTMEASIPVDSAYYQKIPILWRAWGRILRLFAPLM